MNFRKVPLLYNVPDVMLNSFGKEGSESPAGGNLDNPQNVSCEEKFLTKEEYQQFNKDIDAARKLIFDTVNYLKEKYSSEKTGIYLGLDSEYAITCVIPSEYLNL